MSYAYVAAAIAAAVSARGSYVQGQTAKKIGRNNQIMAEYAAQDAQKRAGEDSIRVQQKAAQLKGSQRATMAARGIDLGSDTAVNILTGTDVMGEIDANTVAANAVRAAWGYRTEGTNSQIAASMSEANARGVSPMASATSSLLGNAGSVASTYYSLNKAGAFGR
jgi:hypothetical protein